MLMAMKYCAKYFSLLLIILTASLFYVQETKSPVMPVLHVYTVHCNFAPYWGRYLGTDKQHLLTIGWKSRAEFLSFPKCKVKQVDSVRLPVSL